MYLRNKFLSRRVKPWSLDRGWKGGRDSAPRVAGRKEPWLLSRGAPFSSVFSVFLCVLCGFVFAEEFTYDSHGKKDPFSPPVVSAVEKAGTEVLTGVRLEGIIWDEKKPIAVINDKVVGIGDVVSGAKIIDIKQNEVVFDVNGQTVNVKLRTPEGGQTSLQ